MRNLASNDLSQSLFVALMEELQPWLRPGDLPITLEDDFYRKYGIVDEDLDDLAIAVAKSQGLELPEDTSYWPTPVSTVGDMVDFVATFKQAEHSDWN